MAKGKIVKIVGRISDDIVDKYGLEEVYRCKEIVQSLDLYIHIAKHAPEFDSVDSYNHTIFNIEKIISEPYFVNYDKEKILFNIIKNLMKMFVL